MKLAKCIKSGLYKYITLGKWYKIDIDAQTLSFIDDQQKQGKYNRKNFIVIEDNEKILKILYESK
jgi:hypothetical protein